MKTIVISNTKGGTAKTTTTLNLATELSSLDYKVLLFDLDPQASLSKATLGEENLINFKGIEDLLSNSRQDPAGFIVETKIKNVSIIPCHAELGEVSLKLLMNASF